MSTEHDIWQWQKPGTAWYGVGIYHVTLTVTSRQPVLGTLVIPDDDPKQARVEWSDLGRQVLAHLQALPQRRPEIRIMSFSLMPDHLHAILHVTKPMPTSILSVIRGFWQGEKKIGRAYSMSIAPHSMRENVHTADPLFHEMPFVRPLSRKGQLDTMVRLFDSVAAGRVLILSPWEYDPAKRHVSRAECVAMNQMAEEICNYVHSPEFNSGQTNIPISKQ